MGRSSPRTSSGGRSLGPACSAANQFGLYFQGGTRLNGGNVMGDGLHCAGGAIVRLELVLIDAGGDSSTTIDIPGTAGLAGGEMRAYQLCYRDTAGSPCGNGFNLTNGLWLVWQP